MHVESGYVCLKNVRCYAYHGVLPQERQVGGDYLVSLRVGYPLEKAMKSDQVADTINYAELYALVQREMSQPSHLLEHVAHRIATAIEKTWPLVCSIDLEVAKLNPPMGADCDGALVEIHLKK